MVQDSGIKTESVNLDEGTGNMLGSGNPEVDLTDIWGARTRALHKDTDIGNGSSVITDAHGADLGLV